MPAPTPRHSTYSRVPGSIPVLALFMAVVCAEARGQAIPSEGAQIRVSTDSVESGRWTRGQFISLSSDVLRLMTAWGDTVNVPRGAIYHFQMSEGRYPHTAAGVAVGAGAGAATAF